MLDLTRKALDKLLEYERHKSDKDGHNPIGLYNKAIALAQEAIDAEEREEMMSVPPVTCISILTKREQIAAMAMQAILSSPSLFKDACIDFSNRTQSPIEFAAVRRADALIAELKKEPQ